MPKKIDKYSRYEFTSNYIVASTLLYGYLGDKVSDEKKMQILQKLELPNDIEHANEEDVRLQYGNRFDRALEKAANEEITTRDHTLDMPGNQYWLQLGTGKYYTDPDMEDVVGEFDVGMKDLLEVLDENEKDIDLSDPNAQNHYQMLKGMMKNSYEGNLMSKMSEDPSYGTAIAMTAKIGFESHLVSYNSKEKKFIVSNNGEPTKTVLRETQDLGILQAMAGNARVNEKLQENISNGNTSRQELLYEFEEQSKRLDKVMEMTEEQVEKLRKKNILQNDRSEFTDGPRGIKYSIHDMKAKQELIKAGYPTEDLSVMSAFYVQMSLNSNKLINDQATLDAEKQKNPNPDENLRKKWQEEQKKIDDMKEVTQEMQNAWNEVTNPENGPLTQEKRLETLGKMKEIAQTAKEKKVPYYCLNQFSDRVDNRINAKLTTGDKAMLAGDYSDMYKALQEADPKSLFTGSKQFKELKQAVKELAELEQELSPKERENDFEFRNKRREVLEKSQTYLRYKNRQMNGPDGHKHKRSALETQRVQAVDAVYNRLLSDIERDTPELRLEETEISVQPRLKDSELLTPAPSGEAKDFDTYLRQHTGKGAMSGTKEEMVDDMAKALAAQIMPRQKPPKEFDAKAIDKAAEQIKTKFNLAQMDELDLREALDNPTSVREMAQKNHRKTYSVDMEDYSDYLSSMRRLYRDMEEPDGSSKEYQKIYDNVKKLAHLPNDPEAAGLSLKKVEKMIEQTNSEIYEAVDRYVDKNAKKMGPKDPKVLQVLSAMEGAVPNADKRTDRVVDKIRSIKDVKDISNSEHIELEEFGRNKVYGLRKTADKVRLSKDYQQELMKGLELDEREKLARMKEQSLKEERAKEAPDAALKGKKPEGVNAENAKKSKEVGDKATKNAVKEKKQAARKKIDDGVYL